MSSPAAVGTWRCGCGYLNLGGRACQLCGTPSADGAGARAEVAWGEMLRPTLVGASSPSVVPAIALAVVVIAGNLAMQAVLRTLIEDRGAAAGAYLAVLGGGAFYFAVLAAARAIAPELLHGGPRARRSDAVVDGLLRGGLAIAVAAVAAWTLPGRSGIDPVAASVVDDGRVGLLVLTVLVVGLVGPVVEEVVFRGVVTEGLRRAEVRSAVVISSALFALAHLNPVGFFYFFGVGYVLGRLYLRRGLLASSVAHITLNTGVLVIAFLVLHGGTTSVTAGSVQFDLPTGFHAVPAPPGNTFTATGPEGTIIEIAELALPPGAVFNPDAAASLLTRYDAVNGLRIDPASSHVRLTPFGNGVEATIGDGRRTGVVILVSDGSRLFLFAAHTDGPPDDARLAVERVLASAERAERAG